MSLALRFFVDILKTYSLEYYRADLLRILEEEDVDEHYGVTIEYGFSDQDYYRMHFMISIF